MISSSSSIPSIQTIPSSPFLRRLLRLACVLLVASDLGCGSAPPPFPPKETAPPWNATTLKLFARMCSASTTNVGLFAPSLLPALSLFAEGARGTTREQLVALLGPLDAKVERQRLLALAGIDDLEFTAGVRVWLDERIAPQPAWLDHLAPRDPRGAELERVNFATADRARLAGDVNGWISRIVRRDVRPLTEDDLQLPLRVLVASAAHVAWSWEQKFDARSTQPAPFFPDAARQQPIQVATMNGEQEKSRSVEFRGHLALEIRCAGGVTLDLVKVGGERARRDELLADPHLLEQLDRALAASRPHPWMVALPKVATQATTELGPILVELGAAQAFTPLADFSGLAGAPGELMLGFVRHGAFVEWDEEGGSAGGYDVSGAVLGEAPMPATFDAPFLAFLRGPDGALLLAQWIADPRGP